jgi:hypothetical protein
MARTTVPATAHRTARAAASAACVLLATMVTGAQVHAAPETTGSSNGVRLAVARQPLAAADRLADLTPNQLAGGSGLTTEEALAACGPAAAVAFARASGKPLSLAAAVAAARLVGWTPERGMAGPASQLALLKRLGIAATLEAGIDRARIAREVRAGRPVIVRTNGGERGHYLVAERYDAATGRYDFGQSALVLRGAEGRRWFTLDELPSLRTGSPSHAIYLDGGSTGGSAAEGAVVAMSLKPPAGLAAAATAAATRALGSAVAPAAATGPRSLVVDTGGWGARLRAAPTTDGRVLGLVADGARLVNLGESASSGGRTWRRVADAEGTPAWIDADLVRPVQPSGAVQARAQ